MTTIRAAVAATAERAHHARTGFSPRAHWIWDDGDPSPRNAWRWFRRTFTLEAPTDTATLKITADTRYRVFVNGTQVGHGPIRGYDRQWFVDSWEIAPLLDPTRPNVIAVHVLHFGVSTFADRRKRGGLLAELTVGDDVLLATDETWTVATPASHEPRANRLSCQLGFTEQIDARRDDPSWMTRTFDDSAWANATIIGRAGIAPWETLVPRSIPPLQEQLVIPTQVERLAFVRPAPISAAIDLRAQMSPESADHANHVGYRGYLVTTLRLTRATDVTLVLPGPDFREPGIGIDGVWTPFRELTRGPQESVSLTAGLSEGDHLVVISVSGVDHGHTFSLLVDATDPEAIALASPIDGSDTAFATIGPITGIALGTAEDNWPVPEEIPAEISCRAEAIADTRDLRAFSELVRPVPAAYVSPVSLYGLVVHPRERDEIPVPTTLQTLVVGAPVTIPATADRDTELILDLGREFSGFVTFDIDAPDGTIVDVYGFEYLSGDHREDTIRLDNSLRYVTREGRQRYTSPTRRGMRWLQVIVRARSVERPVIVHELGVIESHYPVTDIGAFESNDPRLNEIWEMSRRTVIACMEDTFVDCPSYEQVFWVGDSYSSSRFASYLFGAEALIERCLRLVPFSAPQSPLLCSHVPSGWDNVIPNFTFFWVRACQEHWFRTGNATFAREIWPAMRDALEAFLTHLNADGLLDIRAWNLLDWAELDQPNAGIVTHQNALFVMALDAANDLAQIAGDAETGARFADAANALRSAVDTHLWSDDAHAYIDAIHEDGRRSTVISVQTQLFALLAGIPQGERKTRLDAAIVERPAEWVQIGSPWMSIFLYDALAERGRTQDAIDDARVNYGMMLDHGATTCWEVFPTSGVAKNDTLTRSHCHAWSAAPAALFPARILGVRGLTPGWTKVLIAPEPCGLRSARGSVPLPGGGAVDVQWKIGDRDRMIVEVSAPVGVEIETVLPTGIHGTFIVQSTDGVTKPAIAAGRARAWARSH